jgi:hypothetical protein
MYTLQHIAAYRERLRLYTVEAYRTLYNRITPVNPVHTVLQAEEAAVVYAYAKVGCG